MFPPRPSPIASTPSNQTQAPIGIVEGSPGVFYAQASGVEIYSVTKAGVVSIAASVSFDAGLPVPHPNAIEFLPASGTVGSRVRIWGYNLLRPSVEFNGVPATGVQSAGPNYVWATVPAGATTGPITVTTPGGSSTTQETFTVQ